MTRDEYLKKRRTQRHWLEIERQAKSWIQTMREQRYNPDITISPPPWAGPTIRESSAPISPAIVGVSDEEYARRADE